MMMFVTVFDTFPVRGSEMNAAIQSAIPDSIHRRKSWILS